jgi:hypothetical protein
MNRMMIERESQGLPPNVSFDQPKNIFRFGEQSIWSTCLLPAGALANTQAFTFSTALNGTGQGFTAALSIAETNQREASRVPNGIAYDVFGVASEIVLAAAGGPDFQIGSVLTADSPEVRDALNVQHNAVLSWFFTQTRIDIAPATLVGSGGGLFGALAQNAAGTATGQLSNGNGSIWLYRKHPVALPGSSTFSIQVNFGSRAPALANPVSLRVTLLGYYKNVIEVA